MYEELVRDLRNWSKAWGEESDPVGLVPVKRLAEAADAIEELIPFKKQVEKGMRLLDKADELLKAVKPHWIPVEERLPEKSGNYLTAFGDGTAMAVNEFMHPRGWLTEEGRKANPNGKWYWGGVTHWMPLPEPPKEEES